MKSFVCATALVLVLPLSTSAQDQPTLGVSQIRLASFSPQRAFAESAEGKAGIARLNALQEKRAREIEARNKALQAQEQALQQSLAVLNDEARSQRTKEVERFRLDTQRLIEDAQAELLGLQKDIEGSFVVRLRPAIEQVARTKGVQVVMNLDQPTIVWADPALDITAEVVARLEKP